MFRQMAMMAPFFTSILWAVTLFLRRNSNSRSKNVWIYCSVLGAVVALIWGYFLSGVESYHLFYKVEIAEVFVLLGYSASLFLYFRALIDEHPFGWEYLWLAPPLLVGGATTILFLLIGEEQSAAFSRAVNEQGDMTPFSAPIYRTLRFLYVDVLNWILRVQIVIVLVYATVRLIHYRRRLADFFSNLDSKSLEGHRAVLIGIYAEIILLSLASVGRMYYKDHPDLSAWMLLGLTVVNYFLSSQIFHMRYSVEDFALEVEEADRMETEAASDGETDGEEESDSASKARAHRKYNTLADNFEQIIMERQLFLQSNLRVSDVARLLNTNRTYISALMTEKFHCSFSYYINGKRVAYAQELMRKHPELTLDQLTEQSGFVYVPSFCRTFKEYTGMTVRSWQRQNISEDI